MRKPPWYGNSQWHGISGAYAGLANELAGVARRFILGMPVDWLSYAGGPSLERLTWSTTTARDDRPPDQVLQVRKKVKRGESMGEYITRKVEVYSPAKQALSRVLKTCRSSSTSLPRSSTS